jgi:hypothetical protein
MVIGEALLGEPAWPDKAALLPLRNVLQQRLSEFGQSRQNRARVVWNTTDD